MTARRYVILGLLVLLGAALIAAPTVFRKPLTPSGSVGQTMKATLEAVESERWQQAGDLAARLEQEWKRAKVPIAINSDATAIREFETQLAMLRTAIRFQDQRAAVTSLAVMTTVIEDLGTY